MSENSHTNQETPFLTIGIASYNYATFLPQAFVQIQKQSFTDYEILYCDDGSTDDSVRVIEELIKNNPDMNIRLVAAQNGGILANKNRIVENACGRYLMICDADDYMLDDCLQALCNVAKTYDADCVIGGFQEVDDAGRVMKKHIPPQDASKWLYTWHHAQIYKLQVVKDNNIHFTQLPDDVFYLQQIHLYSVTTAFVHEVLYSWVRHTDSVTTAIEKHSDWHPAIIWQSLSNYVATLRGKVTTDEDKIAVDYYLYKWYYFNVSDLCATPPQMVRTELLKMKQQMQKVLPGCETLAVLCRALHTGDTSSARMLVAMCWLAERVGLLRAVVWLRGRQRRRRNA